MKVIIMNKMKMKYLLRTMKKKSTQPYLITSQKIKIKKKLLIKTCICKNKKYLNNNNKWKFKKINKSILIISFYFIQIIK